jgi:hypothetical protein
MRHDMNGRSQIWGGKKGIFAERDKCKPVLLRRSLAGNLGNHLCPSKGPNGGSVAMDSGLSRPTIGLSCTQSKPGLLAHTQINIPPLPPASSADTETETASDNLITFL